MNRKRIFAVILKDFKELKKTKKAVLPMIIIPLIFVFIIPVLTLIPLTSCGESSDISKYIGNSKEFIKNFPVYNMVSGDFNDLQKIVYSITVYFFMPFFLLIPVMISSIIAAYSFAGEKENKTIEGLLYTPLTHRELFLGKILVSFIPSILITYLCFVLYSVIVNILCFRIFNKIFFPALIWMLVMFWIVPSLSFLSLSIIIYFSQKAQTAWEAQQVSILLILPVLGVVVSQTSGIFYIGMLHIVIAGIFLWIFSFVFLEWIFKKGINIIFRI